ncbi:MAG: hypothetical protein ABEH58_06910 [Haloplanus sp.]
MALDVLFSAPWFETCDRCGGTVYHEDAHRQVCEERPLFAGECPMCGESYESYTDHLRRCEGGG